LADPLLARLGLRKPDSNEEEKKSCSPDRGAHCYTLSLLTNIEDSGSTGSV
jgi:hypothetical protein